MIVAIRHRREFDELRQHGRAVRSGPLSVRHVPTDDATRTAVGYAIGRRVGNAVVRNRIKRRLREIVRMFDSVGVVPAGTCLIVVSPGADRCTYQALEHHLGECFASSGAAR